MNVVHLTASPFFGGPERQMLGLALALPRAVRSVFLSFPERGLCRPFLDELRSHGFTARELHGNTPRLFAAAAEIAEHLREDQADVLCCHGYKADLVGLLAARRAGIPVVSVSRGWTAATWKVRLYEWLDRRSLPWMKSVVCVSQGQADRVLRAGVTATKVRVIRNAIAARRFGRPEAGDREYLCSLFRHRSRFLVGAVGRLSPEKGFCQLVDAAAEVVRDEPRAGFVLFGDGPLRDELAQQIASRGLGDHFVLAGHRSDLDRWLPCFDLTVLPSYTEGLPNVVLESLAARVPVVATAVGGTPEVVEDGRSGYLVPPGQSEPLARRIGELLGNEARRRSMGRNGYLRVCEQFTFAAQARQYVRLFAELVPAHAAALLAEPPVAEEMLAKSA